MEIITNLQAGFSQCENYRRSKLQMPSFMVRQACRDKRLKQIKRK